MYNKFKVKKKVISIALALALAAQPLATLPMNVFAGTGKNGVYTLNGLKIKNTPSKKVQFFKSGAEICALKLEGVPAGKTVIWTVIKGEDIATVDSNGVVRAKGTKGGKVSVSAKCDGMITGCSFEIGYLDIRALASDSLKDIAELCEDEDLEEERKEYLESIKAIFEQFLKLSDDQIAKYLDKLEKKEVEGPAPESVKLSAEQVQNLSPEEIVEIPEGQAAKLLSLQCPDNPEYIGKILEKFKPKEKKEEDDDDAADFRGGESGSEEEKNVILNTAFNGMAQLSRINGSIITDFLYYYYKYTVIEDSPERRVLSNLTPENTLFICKLRSLQENPLNCLCALSSYYRILFDYYESHEKNPDESHEKNARIARLIENASYSFKYCCLLGGHYLLFFRGVYAYFAVSAAVEGDEEKSKEYEEKFLSTNFLFED